MKQIPETYQECFDILDEKLNQNNPIEGELIRSKIKQNPIQVHHSIGRWIRNEFGLWTGFNERLISLLKKDSESEHPDDWSHHLLTKYAEYLKG